MSLHHKFSTASHARPREEVEDTPRGKEGSWVIMAVTAPRITLSALFQTILNAKKNLMVQGFKGLPQSSYSLVRWVKIFQVLEAEALENPILSLDGTKRSNVEEKNYYQRGLPMVKPTPKGIEETSAGDAIEWIKMWHAIYLEKKKFLRR